MTYGDDETHITGELTPVQIGEAIRHKKFGVDMREAIAQGFQYFDGLQERIGALESEYGSLINDYSDAINRLDADERNINQLKQRCDDLDNLHKKDTELIKKQLDQLNNVVFGHVHEVNYDKPQNQDQHDYYEVIDKSKNRHQLNKDPVSHELNYSTINGKHNSIEIDTGIGHMKGEEL